MNTPSGENRTALDKFVLRYIDKGYDWRFDNDNILFYKQDKQLKAVPTYNENGWINGYIVQQTDLSS